MPSSSTAQIANSSREEQTDLLERMLERDNLLRALERVKQNKGAAGIDGMEVEQLPEHLKQNWLLRKVQLLTGTYQPKPVRRVEFPKPGGGVRLLGIPTVMDRFLQQALLQIITPIIDPQFSPHSYGFRPGKSAHDAVKQAQAYIQEGNRYVVDMDLEKFFDRVNHDILMARVARRVKDKRILKLIRSYLNAGVMATVTRYVEGKLRLKVNREKSAVDRPWKRQFLGFSFLSDKKATIRLAPKTLERFKERIRQLTCRTKSEPMDEKIRKVNNYLVGWIGYFQLASAKKHCEGFDQWIRRRLRMCLWKQWKKPRARQRNLRALGTPEWAARMMAYARSGSWVMARNTNNALDTSYWRTEG